MKYSFNEKQDWKVIDKDISNKNVLNMRKEIQRLFMDEVELNDYKKINR